MPANVERHNSVPGRGRWAFSDKDGRGFTLIELLAVIAIMAVLAGIVVAVASHVLGVADRKAAQARIAVISLALDRYNAAYSCYPSNFTLAVGSNPGVFSKLAIYAPDLLTLGLQTNTTRTPPCVEILDPWGNPFIYTRPRYRPGGATERLAEDSFELRSQGPDGLLNTKDDIVTARGD
jgi:prepilin-type N-terminal cleavage/methylation domain-containing protein